MIGCELVYAGNEFYRETSHRARKPRRCGETGHEIAKGERYVYISAMTDGEFWTFSQSVRTYHLCRALNAVYNIRQGIKRGCVIPFDGLREVDDEDFGECGFGITEDFHPAVGRCFCAHLQRIPPKDGDGWPSWFHAATDADWQEVERVSREYSTCCVPEAKAVAP